MFKSILFHVKDGVASVTINRPEVSNSFSPDTYPEIRSAMELCDGDAQIRAVRITGSGTHFSAGGDIKRFRQLIDSGNCLPREGVLQAGQMVDSVRKCRKPVVAVLNGATIGAGAGLALACDFRVMEESSRIAFSFINMGFSGDTGTMYFLMRMLGAAKTTELMMLGDSLNGKESYSLGLASRLAPTGQLTSEADRLITELCNKPTHALGRQKQMMYEFFAADFLNFTEREADFMHDTGKTADHREAVTAFLEKRRPVFTGM